MDIRRGHVGYFFAPGNVGGGAKWPNRYSNPVALHCRATLCRTTFSKIWRGVAGESRYEKGPVAPTFSVLKGGVHFKLLLGRCRGAGGCRSYTVTCRAAVGHLEEESI